MKSSQVKACRMVDQAMAGLVVGAGETERAIARQIKAKLNDLGARPAFRTIVASGKRSAKPHGSATNKLVKKGELVVIDFGALYNGYRSDITRTIVIGKPSQKQRKIFQIVKAAQKKAFKAVRAGRICSEVDQAAREYIAKQGFGKNFIHSTGHGIGRKVHQAPKISKRNRRRLKVGMVITIEPGIYIKGWGGVRIEDMVLVTKRGGKVLTKTAKILTKASKILNPKF